MLWEISKQIEGHTICALGDGAAWPVQVNIGSYGFRCHDIITGIKSFPSSFLVTLWEGCSNDPLVSAEKIAFVIPAVECGWQNLVNCYGNCNWICVGHPGVQLNFKVNPLM